MKYLAAVIQVYGRCYRSHLAAAQQTGGAAPAALAEPSIGQLLFNMLPMFVVVYLIFYILVTKPQQKKPRSSALFAKG